MLDKILKLSDDKSDIFIGGCYVTVKRNLNFSKTFDFKIIEPEIYSQWIAEEQFKPKKAKQKFFIPMPPPNITGILHIGHASFLSIQDALTRYYRKDGKQMLWLPGTDHAGLATHDKIIESFQGEQFTKEEYLERGAELKHKFQTRITTQIKATGASCDWSRLQYTMDRHFHIAALEALNRLDRAGLIYRKDNQWYISMKSMADDLMAGLSAGAIRINDESELNKLKPMLSDIQDWCISRQIHWGYQMPIFFNDDGQHFITENIDEARLILGETAQRELSTLDTWFTSSLWPMATLGWPEKTKDYEDFYPAQMIETGADILFFWCAKMLMMGKFLTGIYPFNEILLHGICRDKDGKKMSKSLGNGIDPLDIIEKYGADALRFGLLSQTTHKDIKINEGDFAISAKFINKIWQASRFFEMNLKRFPESANFSSPIGYKDFGDFTPELDKISKKFHQKMKDRNFLEAIRDLQYSFKHEFCDLWIEKSKLDLRNNDEKTMEQGLAILYFYLNHFHCFIPFITEKIAMGFWGLCLINTTYED